MKKVTFWKTREFFIVLIILLILSTIICVTATVLNFQSQDKVKTLQENKTNMENTLSDIKADITKYHVDTDALYNKYVPHICPYCGSENLNRLYFRQ